MANISQEVNIEMLEKLADGTYRKKNPATKAEAVKLVDAQNKFTNKNVEGAMQELFTNVSDGKDLVGGAITDVDENVVIPTDPTFNDLASAIGGISTGKKWASGVFTGQTYQKTESITMMGFYGEISNTGNRMMYKSYPLNLGIDFTPSIIIIKNNGNDKMIISREMEYPLIRLGSYGSLQSSPSANTLLSNTTYFYSGKAFTSDTLTWIAYE